MILQTSSIALFAWLSLLAIPAPVSTQVGTWKLAGDGERASNGEVFVLANRITVHQRKLSATDAICFVRGHVVRAKSILVDTDRDTVTLTHVGTE